MKIERSHLLQKLSPVILGLLCLCVVWLLVEESRKVKVRRPQPDTRGVASVPAMPEPTNRMFDKSVWLDAKITPSNSPSPPAPVRGGQSALQFVTPKPVEGPFNVERKIRLADAREIAFGGVTYGLEHFYRQEKPVAKVAAAPAEEKAKRDQRTISIKTAFPSLVVWLHCRSASGSLFQGDFISLVDEGGREGELSKPSAIFNSAESESVGAWEVPNFPRRDANFGVRLYSRDSSNRVHRMAEFRAANPAPRTEGTWVGEPLPIVKKSGNTEFRLVSISCDDPVAAGAPFANRSAEEDARAPWSTCMFQAVTVGEPATQWQVDSIALTDATGNVCLPDSTHLARVGAFLVFSFNRTFWSSERAGKVRAEFTRTSGFNKRDLITFRRLAIPPVNRRMTLGLQQKAGAVTVRLEEIIQHNPPVLMDQAYWNLELTAALIPSTPGVHLTLADVTDQLGRVIAPGVSHKLPQDRQSFLFRAAPGAEMVDLALAVQQGEVVEFLPILPRAQSALDARRNNPPPPVVVKQAGLKERIRNWLNGVQSP